METTTKQSETLQAALEAAGVDPAALSKVAAAAIAVVLSQEASIDEKDEALVEATKFNGELQEKLNILSTGGKIVLTVKVGDKSYNIIHGVKLDGKIFNPKDIAENADVAKKLAEGNSSALELSEETE